MLKAKQASATGNLQQESCWEPMGPPFLSGAHLVAGTFGILMVPPTNQAAAVGIGNEPFSGTALTAATTSKGNGVLNAPLGSITGFWIFMALAGAGTSTAQLQCTSCAVGQAPVTTNWSAVTALSGLAQGWQLITMTIPAERQGVVGNRPPDNKLGLIYPGDIFSIVIGTSTPPAGTVYGLDAQ